jgi:hypothetical protein
MSETSLELLRRMSETEHAMPLPISWDLRIVFADGAEGKMCGTMNGRGTYGLNGENMLTYELGKALRRIVKARAREICGAPPDGRSCP